MSAGGGLAQSAVASVQCWLGLDEAAQRSGWRGWWAATVFYVLAFLMVLSVIRFFVNPLFCFENSIIVLVLAAYVANARRFRLLLAAR